MDNNVVLYKDQQGDVWFLGIFSNNFEDRQGDIITWDAHKEYAQWFKGAKTTLPIVMLHQPKIPGYFHLMHTWAMEKGLITPQVYAKNMRELYEPTTVATAEAVIPLNGFALVAGKVRKDRYEMVEKMTGSWGMSHGFIILEQGDNIITKYRTFEFTLAPVEWAANAITLIGFTNEEKMTEEKLTKEDRDLLEGFLNGSADDLESATEKARDILARVFNSKTLGEVTEEEAAEEEEAEDTEDTENEETTDYEVLRDKLFADLDVPGLVGAFKQFGVILKEYDQKFADLEKNVRKTDDERVAEYISPDWKWVFADHETEGEQDKELLDTLKEKADREITEDTTEPSTSNPLTQGFWGQIARGEN